MLPQRSCQAGTEPSLHLAHGEEKGDRPLKRAGGLKALHSEGDACASLRRRGRKHTVSLQQAARYVPLKRPPDERALSGVEGAVPCFEHPFHLIKVQTVHIDGGGIEASNPVAFPEPLHRRSTRRRSADGKKWMHLGTIRHI